MKIIKRILMGLWLQVFEEDINKIEDEMGMPVEVSKFLARLIKPYC